MTLSPGFTNAEIRAYVFEYQQQPYGTKTAWLKGKPFSKHQFCRWQEAVFRGDLDRGLVPREGGTMTPRRKREFVEQSVEALQSAHDAEVAALSERIRMLEGTNDALGKAIGLLHAMREEPDELATKTTRTTGPSDS